MKLSNNARKLAGLPKERRVRITTKMTFPEQSRINWRETKKQNPKAYVSRRGSVSIKHNLFDDSAFNAIEMVKPTAKPIMKPSNEQTLAVYLSPNCKGIGTINVAYRFKTSAHSNSGLFELLERTTSTVQDIDQ